MSDRLLIASGDAAHLVRAAGTRALQHSRTEIPGAECAAISSVDDQLAFVGSHGDGVHRSTDGGVTFERLDCPQKDVLSIAVSPADGAVYAGCEPSALLRSRDGGETWEDLEALKTIPSHTTWSFPPRPWTHHVRQIAPSPHDPRLILAGIELGGIMRSTDDGVTWSDHRPQGVKDCHGLMWHPTVPGRAYEAGGGGSAWSHDDGESWFRIDDGRDHDFRHYLTGIAVDPLDPDVWYVSAAQTPRQTLPPRNADAAIYRWSGDGPWKKVEGGLPAPLDRYPYSLFCTEDTLFAGLKDGRVWAGRARATRWELLELEGIPDVRQIVAVTE